MYFKVNNVNPKLTLYANDRDLKGRFSAISPQYMTDKLGENFLWAKYINRESRMRERTLPMLGYDSVVGRPVILKVCKYGEDEVVEENKALKRRKVLDTQIELLNDISSPLLPEPLDWFTVSNKVDGFSSDDLAASEPVLVLDYISGDTLNYACKYGKFDRFEKITNEYGKDEYKSKGVNVTKMCMFMSRMVDFLKVLHKKNYMVTSLAPEHILVLNNEIPRFLGLGRICKVKENGTFDTTHINYGRMIKGYAAPELNKPETNFGENANALAAGVYSLGVIMAQMICNDFEIHSELLKDGAVAYPNEKYRGMVLNAVPEKGAVLDRLLLRLCNPNPHRRLTDLEEIELILKEIGGILMEEEKEKLKEIRRKRKEAQEKRKEAQESKKNDNDNPWVTLPAKVVSFDRAEVKGKVKLIDFDLEIEITKEFLESCGLSYLIVGKYVDITVECLENEDMIPRSMWVSRKADLPVEKKDDDKVLTPKVKKSICTVGKVLEFDREKGKGVVILQKTKEKIVITRELLESCGLSYLIKNADVEIVLECLDNGTKRAVRVLLKKSIPVAEGGFNKQKGKNIDAKKSKNAKESKINSKVDKEDNVAKKATVEKIEKSAEFKGESKVEHKVVDKRDTSSSESEVEKELASGKGDGNVLVNEATFGELFKGIVKVGKREILKKTQKAINLIQEKIDA